MAFPALRAAAFLLSASFVPFSAFAAEHEIRIQGFAFAPANLTVAVGDTITFINKDGAPHTATATDGSFDTGRLRRNDDATITVEAPGTVNYFCEVHPSMKRS